MNVCLPVAIVSAALVALPAPAAHAAEPADQLNAQIARVFESLKHRDTPAPERQAEVRRIAFEIFDFTETAVVRSAGTGPTAAMTSAPGSCAPSPR